MCSVLPPSIDPITQIQLSESSSVLYKMENVCYLTTFKFLEPSSLYEDSSLLLVSGRVVAFLGKSR